MTINLPNENDNIIEEWYVDEKAEIFESEEEYSFRLSLIRILDDDWNYIDNFQPIINNLIKKKNIKTLKSSMNLIMSLIQIMILLESFTFLKILIKIM